MALWLRTVAMAVPDSDSYPCCVHRGSPLPSESIRSGQLAFPEYKQIEEPLLCYMYRHGGPKFQVRTGDAYQAMADHFGLMEDERWAHRTGDDKEPQWNNMVRWARRKLKDAGYLDSDSPHGVWRLSAAGIARAKRRCSSSG